MLKDEWHMLNWKGGGFRSLTQQCTRRNGKTTKMLHWSLKFTLESCFDLTFNPWLRMQTLCSPSSFNHHSIVNAFILLWSMECHFTLCNIDYRFNLRQSICNMIRYIWYPGFILIKGLLCLQRFQLYIYYDITK